MNTKRLGMATLAASTAAIGLIVALLNARPFTAADDISPVAAIALPVALVAALLYWIIRRESRVLAQLNERLDEAAKACGLRTADAKPAADLRRFAQHFAGFMQLADAKMHELDRQALEAQTASSLLAYKHEKAEAVLDSIPEAVLVVDHACVPTFANPKVEPLLGVSREALIGNPPQQWCSNKEVLALLMRFTQGMDAAVHTARIEYTPEAQPDRRIAVSVHPLFSPRDRATLFGMLVVFRDITREYTARQAGAEFVAHVSHELKTPLATLAAYSELLMGYQTLPENERVNAVNVIRDEVERTAALIGNLLSISKLETGNLQIARHRVKVHDLLQASYDSMSKNATTKGVALELKIPPDLGSARLDKDLFRIALDNLLSNAIKYSDTGGQVTLGAEHLEDQKMKISVKDHGIGMSAEDCAKVFDKYYRSSSKEAISRSGHGLGLYLVKQIVELHNGVISVASELGKGTTFTIDFEAQQAKLEEVPQA